MLLVPSVMMRLVPSVTTRLVPFVTTRALPSVALALLAAAAGAQQKAIAGRVLDATPAPVADARVIVRWRTHPELPGTVGHGLTDDGCEQVELEVDDAGRFRFEAPHRGPFYVVAEHGELRGSPAFPVVPGDFVEQVLGPVFVVGGLVVHGGVPSPDVVVRIADADSQSWWRRAVYGYPGRGATTRTGADGRFALPLDRGYLSHPIWYPPRALVAEAAGRFSAPTPTLRPVESAREVELVLTDPAVVVRVRDRSGAAVAGARVVDPRVGGAGFRTDAAGRAFVRAGIHHAWIVAEGYAYHEIAIDDAAGAETTLRLPRAERMTVGVVRLGGEPLRRARVLVSIPSVDGPPLELMTETSAAGSLDFRGVPDGVPAYLFVEVDGRFRPFLRAHGPAAAFASCDVPDVYAVEGQVLDADGVPAGHARVALRTAGWPTWFTWGDRAGHFRFEIAVPGTGEVELGAQADGRGFAWTTVARSDLGVGSVELRVERGRRVEGRVVDPDGAGVPGAWVTVMVAGDERVLIEGAAQRFMSQVVFADTEGRFVFRDMPLGVEPTVLSMAIVGGVRLQGTATVQRTSVRGGEADPPGGGAVELEIELEPVRD